MRAHRGVEPADHRAGRANGRAYRSAPAPIAGSRFGSSKTAVKPWHTRIQRMSFCRSRNLPQTARFFLHKRAFRRYGPRLIPKGTGSVLRHGSAPSGVSSAISSKKEPRSRSLREARPWGNSPGSRPRSGHLPGNGSKSWYGWSDTRDNRWNRVQWRTRTAADRGLAARVSSLWGTGWSRTHLSWPSADPGGDPTAWVSRLGRRPRRGDRCGGCRRAARRPRRGRAADTVRGGRSRRR